MYKNEEFSIRLNQLRTDKGVSARKMSMEINKNQAYINNIETGRAMPTMTTFFVICEYLNISPKDFFCDNKSRSMCENCSQYKSYLLNQTKTRLMNVITEVFNED